MLSKTFFSLALPISLLILLFACQPTEEPAPQCDGSLAVSVSSVTDSPCGEESGQINVAATGGDGTYQFQLDGGEFGTSSNFEGITPGGYLIKVKDGNDCEAEIRTNVQSGVVFADVMNLIETNCAISNCHDGSNNRREDLSELTGIKNNASEIKSRINEKSMPPEDQDTLRQVDIDLLTCWIDDGTPE